ncbi:MAG: carboxypeptidase-like regulatory domain-containing protein, partial [Flavisolibacter sp.]
MRSFILPLLAVFFVFIAAFNTGAHRVKGTIKDENGNALAGVSVMEKGSRNGTTSASDGSYSISVKDGSATLVFAYIGHAKEEVEIKGQMVINVVLKVSAANLEEVVVTGYDSQVLQGSVAGIAINGKAASASKMRIRGATTFNGYSNNNFNTEA